MRHGGQYVRAVECSAKLSKTYYCWPNVTTRSTHFETITITSKITFGVLYLSHLTIILGLQIFSWPKWSFRYRIRSFSSRTTPSGPWIPATRLLTSTTELTTGGAFWMGFRFPANAHFESTSLTSTTENKPFATTKTRNRRMAPGFYPAAEPNGWPELRASEKPGKLSISILYYA